MAERSVKTVESLLEKSSDPYMAILNYRATPLPWCNLSPVDRYSTTTEAIHTRLATFDWISRKGQRMEGETEIRL